MVGIDDSLSPVFVIRVDGKPTDTEYARLLGDLTREFFREARPYAVVYQGNGSITPSQRRMQIRWLSENETQIRKWGRGVAFAFSSPMLRSALRLIFWVSPPFYPFVLVPTLDEGIAWARQQLAD